MKNNTIIRLIVSSSLLWGNIVFAKDSGEPQKAPLPEPKPEVIIQIPTDVSPQTVDLMRTYKNFEIINAKKLEEMVTKKFEQAVLEEKRDSTIDEMKAEQAKIKEASSKIAAVDQRIAEEKEYVESEKKLVVTWRGHLDEDNAKLKELEGKVYSESEKQKQHELKLAAAKEEVQNSKKWLNQAISGLQKAEKQVQGYKDQRELLMSKIELSKIKFSQLGESLKTAVAKIKKLQNKLDVNRNILTDESLFKHFKVNEIVKDYEKKGKLADLLMVDIASLLRQSEEHKGLLEDMERRAHYALEKTIIGRYINEKVNELKQKDKVIQGLGIRISKLEEKLEAQKDQKQIAKKEFEDFKTKLNESLDQRFAELDNKIEAKQDQKGLSLEISAKGDGPFCAQVSKCKFIKTNIQSEIDKTNRNLVRVRDSYVKLARSRRVAIDSVELDLGEKTSLKRRPEAAGTPAQGFLFDLTQSATEATKKESK